MASREYSFKGMLAMESSPREKERERGKEREKERKREREKEKKIVVNE